MNKSLTAKNTENYNKSSVKVKRLTLNKFLKLTNCKLSEVYIGEDASMHTSTIAYKNGQFTVLYDGHFGTGDSIEAAKRNAEWQKQELEQLGY